MARHLTFRALALPALLPLFAAPASASVQTLSPGDSLPAAVAAAAPGDVLVLLAGTYTDPLTLEIDKPLTLLGAGAAVTSFAALGTSPIDKPLQLLVRDLAVGEEVRVVGLTVGQQSFLGTPSTTVRIEDCAGPVVLADVRTFGASDPTLGLGLGVVQVRDCAQVLIDGCDFEAGAGAAVGDGSAPTLSVERSDVSINASSVRGPAGQKLTASHALLQGGPAIRALDAGVRAARSSIRGGDGAASSLAAAVGAGGAGLEATATVVALRGGPGNEVRGGDGAVSGFDPAVVAAGGSALLLGAATQATATSDAVLAGGLAGGGGAPAPAVDPAGTGDLQVLPSPLATVRTSPIPAPLGALSVTDVAGEPFAVALLGYALELEPPLELPGVLGPVLLDLSGVLFAPVQVLDAGGTAVWSTPLPTSSGLVGVGIVRQAATVAPSGLVSVSPPGFQALRP